MMVRVGSPLPLVGGVSPLTPPSFDSVAPPPPPSSFILPFTGAASLPASPFRPRGDEPPPFSSSQRPFVRLGEDSRATAGSCSFAFAERGSSGRRSEVEQPSSAAEQHPAFSFGRLIADSNCQEGNELKEQFRHKTL